MYLPIYIFVLQYLAVKGVEQTRYRVKTYVCEKRMQCRARETATYVYLEVFKRGGVPLPIIIFSTIWSGRGGVCSPMNGRKITFLVNPPMSKC